MPFRTSVLRVSGIDPSARLRKFIGLSTFHNWSPGSSIIWNSQIRKAYSRHRKIEMDKVYLRNDGANQDLHISFRFTDEEMRVDRDFNFCRKMNENIDDALARIRNNIEKEINKKNKKGKKKSTDQTQEVAKCNLNMIPVEIVRSDLVEKVENMTFEKLLAKCSDLKLRVMDKNFEIVYNMPWVLSLSLPTCILAGFRVYPSKVEIQFADRKNSVGNWYKAKKPSSGDMLRGADWTHCGSGFHYDTDNSDIGYFLKFQLTPGNEAGQLGPSVEQITKNEVQPGPGQCPFELRHSFTKHRLSGDYIRVVSYNILADLYADSDYTRTHLFPYCPPYALKIDYRKQLYIKEIIGYNADIICLQEVDVKIFDLDLVPILESDEYGYQGVIAQKGTCGEGVAIFYHKSRFEMYCKHELNIGEGIRTLPLFADLWKKIENNKNLVERICDRSTTLQVLILKCKENGRYLLVTNTHLYFHPDADHIRLLQMGFAMLYVKHIYNDFLKKINLSDERELSLIFSGDFNSVPECGIYKLMIEGNVGKDFVDWISNREEAVRNVTLSQPFKMKSACGTPPYTNYTHAFAACLDYIFYQSDRLQVHQVVPLPTEDELKSHTAIPSVVFPSDHVALVADLKFKPI
ncbi:2',5'-phosphodiesterase 12 [Ceratitis capitata]|uniref:2',5'-phosphodiesterase 12 n=1 Tax=Ceratitis capitata TaxID=7213 RepID=W8CD91_CERCA|nr:2',5'-phosphodiesterase 12 [Ceratitis capitata]XP_004527107.1 2',5'-phosphodiesterase 12 [Ceratitis capitata]